MKKRILATLMMLITLTGMLPFSVTGFAVGAENSSSVTISLTAQMENGFLCAPQKNLEVMGDAAENYGFTDVIAGGVSALDVLVRAHELVFGEGFTEETVGSLLVVEGSSVKTIFGVETINCGFAVNGETLHDDILIESPYGDYYMGYSVNTAEIAEGDTVEFFLYQDEYALDNYIWFEKDGEKLSSLSVPKDETTDIKLKGYCIGWYGCNTKDFIDGQTVEISDVRLCLVNSETGAKTDIEGAVSDENGNVSFSLAEQGSYLLSAYMPIEEIEENYATPVIMPILPITVLPDACITIPSDAELFVGSKEKHFMNFDEISYVCSVENESDGTTTYYFDLTDNKTYNFRVSGENYITYAGTFKKIAGYHLAVTQEMLCPDGKEKTTVDRDTFSNNGYNVADIYLNINAQGYLKLDAAGDTYQLVPLRNWETVDNTSNNYFIEPDFHYTVLDEAGDLCDSVVSINDDGLVTAVGEGTAIVMVTYDAINVASAAGGPFFGAIWPENTAVFVITVGATESAIKTGMTINEGLNDDSLKLSGDALDAEHDVIYFVGEQGSYVFTPETEGCTVSAANPKIANGSMGFSGFHEVNVDAAGAFSVPLTEGRNIVKLEKDGKCEYQVITAKKVCVTINNGEEVHVGDSISIVFDTLYHPAQKLAGVYNMDAVPIYRNVSVYSDKLAGGLPAKYNFASNEAVQTVAGIVKKEQKGFSNTYVMESELMVPVDYQYDTFTLSEGSFEVFGFGDPYGNHRGITLTEGKAPNLNAANKEAWLGKLPDIEIPIAAPGSDLISITLGTEGVKTDYYCGETFDPTNLIVTANYENDTAQIATNYTVLPETITDGTEAVTITYRGKTAEIPINVVPLRVNKIEVTTPPVKTAYDTGNVFDPTGMVVTATYNSGKTAIITDYSYSPNRELTETDEGMTITYTGEDGQEDIPSITIPITVSSLSSGGASSNDITVKFTLYGDEKHGENSGTIHTYKSRNLDKWVEKISVSVPKGSYVIDVVKKALAIAGIPYSNSSGDYIESVKGLSEFDNGSLSGWMYLLNNKIPKVGIAEQTVKNGDNIIFYYTDDYTQEEKWSVSSSSRSGRGNVTAKETVSEEKKEETMENETVAEEKQFHSFSDISSDNWFYEAVTSVYTKGLMKGVSETKFAPDKTLTRAELITILYRMENEPEIAEETFFTDVAADSWFAPAVAWAKKCGIASGVSDTEFVPNGSITREQIAMMMKRYADLKGHHTEKRADTTAFGDADEISDWAQEALSWAMAEGLLGGRSDSELAPRGIATRAEVAMVLVRFIAEMDKV